MESPSKQDKLIVQEQALEEGQDGMPQDIWDDMKRNERFLYYGLMFLNGSVLWAYYSCLSAQNFYAKRFARPEGELPKEGEKDLDFGFLTTLVAGWPMVVGHFLQMVFALDKKWDQNKRVYAGYLIFILMAICIIVFSAIDFGSDYEGRKLGGTLVLVCFGVIGAANSLSESTYYMMAALFPVEKFTNGVQIGNVSAGVVNITVLTLLRLAVGGVDQTGDTTTLSFYLFFGLMIVVCVAAMYVYSRMMQLPCVRFLIERNQADTAEHGLATQGIASTLGNLARIFRIIWVPAMAQFLIFFVSLAVFPGFGCAGGRILSPAFNKELTEGPVSSHWYCTPGIIGSYNYGDFLGRILCTATVYKIFTMKLSFILTCLRVAYIPLMLLGVGGSSLYVFGGEQKGESWYFTDITSPLIYNVLVNFTIGLSTGLLSTVTIGTAPRLVEPKDRESAGSITVLLLFLGIAGGATFGAVVSDNHWLGL